MHYDIIIRNIGQLATPLQRRVCGPAMDELTILENVDIGISEGKIERIGDLKGEKAKEVIDAGKRLAMPGFVDSHTHLPFHGTREFELEMKLKGAPYLEILKQGGGILYTMKKTREATKEQLVQNGLKLLDTMLAFGTTTVEAKSGYGLDVETELKLLEVIGELNQRHEIDVIPTFLGCHTLPPEYKGNREGYLDLMTEGIMPEIERRGLASYCDVFLEDGVFNVEESRHLMEKAKKYGMKAKLHVDEIVNLGGSRLAAELGAVSADHLAKTSPEDMKALAEAGVVGNLLPGTSFTLMKDYAPARQMIEAGMCLALSTDFNPNCWVLSMPVVMSLSCYNMKMSPAEVFSAATINGAASVERDAEIGSLHEGKQADIVLLDLDNYKQLPYMFATSPVMAVLKKGELVYEK